MKYFQHKEHKEKAKLSPENIFHSEDHICICPWTPSECHPRTCLCKIAEESSGKQPQKPVQTHCRVCTEE